MSSKTFKVGDKVTITEEGCNFFSSINLSPSCVYIVETVEENIFYTLKGFPSFSFLSDELKAYEPETITLPRDVVVAWYKHFGSIMFTGNLVSKPVSDLYKVLEKELEPDFEEIKKAREFLESNGFSVEKKNE